MSSPDVAIFTVHWAFWGAFGLTRIVLRIRDRNDSGAVNTAPIPQQETTAPFSRALLAFHGLAFAVMYFGISYAVIPGRVPFWFPGQRVAGSLVIAGGAALVVSALVSFRSWRFRATLDKSHQLAIGGPFRILRHPIYMGLNLLALGTALWVPTAIVWTGFMLMAIGGDLRARAEETLLTHAFGPSYREYCARTRRFVPGLY
ncbi:MAG TPA: isoprenylcysteine carboxylmethyltransferase family protein [Acidobacteriota bacterium]|jgi:protein-S-isoprenylcysteine O-methyltransferase Ste14